MDVKGGEFFAGITEWINCGGEGKYGNCCGFETGEMGICAMFVEFRLGFLLA